MHIDYKSAAVLGVWALGFGALAFSTTPTTSMGWAILAGITLLPPVVLVFTLKLHAESVAARMRSDPRTLAAQGRWQR
jgi:hypothetical protein